MEAHYVFERSVKAASRLAGNSPAAFLRVLPELYATMLQEAGLRAPSAPLAPIPAQAAARVSAKTLRWSVERAGLTVAPGAGLAQCVALGTLVGGTFRKELTGVLIKESVVLTAAHTDSATQAVFADDLSASSLEARSIYNWSPPAESGRMGVDVILSYLTQAAPVSAAALATTREVESAATGWVVKFGSDRRKIVVEVTISPCTGSDCDAQTELAAWDVAGTQDLCAGDSGAPLYIDVGGDARLAGVMSRGLQSGICAKGAVFSRPDRVPDWLENHTLPL